ncbi:Uncharacterized protein TCM_018484 [Theobroma cacao]|uniref:Uncharacterized protein n=1 Tax=Theobroma cacao TaxID=3641 RepID=A0A061EER5_THECC|nr:Uncharacterized protein TCM_018484 [Theobroma cacao]
MVEKRRSSLFRQHSMEIQLDLVVGSTESGASRPDPTIGSSTPQPDPAAGKRRSGAIVARSGHMVRQIDVLLHQSPFQ